jgi:predicted nuclease of predicted toxin-antitoxin system
MKILLDMNLSPNWKEFLEKNEYITLHWTEIGEKTAPDSEIFDWASKENYIIFLFLPTILIFGAILAFTNAIKPSVVQVSTQDVTLDYLGETFLLLLKKFEIQLKEGAIVTFDEEKMKVKILPFK